MQLLFSAGGGSLWSIQNLVPPPSPVPLTPSGGGEVVLRT